MRRSWLGIAVVALLARALGAQAYADAPLARGTLSFDAKATLGAFTGSTTSLKGLLEGAPTLSGVRGWVEAPARSLSSQNGKRDRDTWSSLEVEKYPTLRFQLDSVAPGEAQRDSTGVVLLGRLTLHGQTHPVRLPGWVWRRGGRLRFRGAVPVNLKEYRVGGLTKALGMLRMDEHIIVRVDVSFDAGEGP